MTTQISPQIKLAALVGVLLIVLAGSALVVLRHTAPGGPTASAGRHSAPAVTPPHHSSAPVVKVVQPTVDPLLPAPLRTSLERHRVVVVAFYDPQVKVDLLALAEARAGALGGGVGFRGVNLLQDSVAGRLTALLPAGTLLPAPGILVYNRAGKVLYRYDGYLDRAAIAQAVENVR